MVCNNNKANHSARSSLIRGGLGYQILLNQEIDNEPLTVIYIYMYLKIIAFLTFSRRFPFWLSLYILYKVLNFVAFNKIFSDFSWFMVSM